MTPTWSAHSKQPKTGLPQRRLSLAGWVLVVAVVVVVVVLVNFVVVSSSSSSSLPLGLKPREEKRPNSGRIEKKKKKKNSVEKTKAQKKWSLFARDLIERKQKRHFLC